MHGVSKSDREVIGKRIGIFVRQYGRKAQAGMEPNDRSYDRKIERYIRRLKPEDLDVLLHGEEDERLKFSEPD